MLGKTAKDMFVDVTIGVPDLRRGRHRSGRVRLPYGTVTVTAVKGGLKFLPRVGAMPSLSPTLR